MTTPAEKAILDRITRHPNARRFDYPLRLGDRRYYLAYSKRGSKAVLRLKDQPGLAEWRTRRWQDPMLIPDPPPIITDVTIPVLQAIEYSLSMPFDDFQKSRTWVEVEAGHRFLFTTLDRAPTPTARLLWPPGVTVGSAAPLIGVVVALRPLAAGLGHVVPSSGMCFQSLYGTVYFTPHRAFIWRGAPPVPHPANAGGPIDGVATLEPMRGNYASRGKPIMIEAGSAFEENAILECDAEGRAVARSTGVGVLRALEQATCGQVVWAVFT